MYHALYSTCAQETQDDPYTLLQAAITGQAASDAISATATEAQRHYARRWLAENGICEDVHIQHIYEAYVSWKKVRDLVRQP